MPALRIQYPKLLLLCASFALAYVLYLYGVFDILPEILKGKGYIATFLAGMLFTFGFTAAFGLAILFELSDEIHPLLGTLVGGAGAVLADMLIFEVARFSLRDELRKLASIGLFRRAIRLLYHENVSETIRAYILWSVAGLVIASPLPDEIGVTLLSGIPRLNPRKLALVCFVLDSAGILAVLLIARAVGA